MALQDHQHLQSADPASMLCRFLCERSGSYSSILLRRGYPLTPSEFLFVHWSREPALARVSDSC